MECGKGRLLPLTQQTLTAKATRYVIVRPRRLILPSPLLTDFRGRTEGTPPKAYPSRPWANLASPKPPKRTSAKSGDFDEGKRKVYEAALAEPEPVHFPPLKLSPARSTNPDPEQASTNGGKLRRRRAGSTKATELKRTLSKVRGAVAPWGRSLTFAPKTSAAMNPKP